MLSQSELELNFSEVKDLGKGVYRCKDVLPRITIYYYVRIGSLVGASQDLLVVSENLADDDFARLIFTSVCGEVGSHGLHIVTLLKNQYGFPQVVIASAEYHSYFKGRLDRQRNSLFLCLPSYPCEFTGRETVDEFSLIRRDIVPSLNWRREMSPQVLLCFDNPKTKSSTGGREIYVKQSVVQREIDLLSGVINGFVEIVNYKREVIEVLSPATQEYILISDRNDETRRSISRDELGKFVESFLIR